jgi:hypothetical protein
MYDCTVCGLCVTEANTNQGDNNMDTKLSIAFGRRTFPEDVQAVWGARLIFPNDLVWDRQDLDSHDDDAKQSLIAWLNGPNTGDGAIKKMRAILADTNKRYEISPDLGSGRGDDEAVIYEDDEGKIIGSPQSSGGYLYVCGWLKAHTKEG